MTRRDYDVILFLRTRRRILPLAVLGMQSTTSSPPRSFLWGATLPATQTKHGAVRCLSEGYVYAVSLGVPEGLPSRGGDATVYALDINQPSLPTFLKILFLCLFLSLWPIQLYFIPWILPTTPFSHSVLPVLILPYWSFQLYISLWKPTSALV